MHRLYGRSTPPRVSRERRQLLSKLTARAGDTYPKEYPWRAEKEALSVLECVRMVATEIEMAAPGFAPVTPPQRVSTAPSSPLGGPGIELHEVCSAAVADGLPGIGADAEVLGGVVADGAQTGTGADLASFGAVASGILDEEGQSAVADVLQPGIGADAEVLAAVASGILDEEGQYRRLH